MSAPTSTPAGWYPDPSAPTNLRWWDGAQWSEHVQLNPQAPAPLSVPAQAPSPPVFIHAPGGGGLSKYVVALIVVVVFFILIAIAAPSFLGQIHQNQGNAGPSVLVIQQEEYTAYLADKAASVTLHDSTEVLPTGPTEVRDIASSEPELVNMLNDDSVGSEPVGTITLIESTSTNFIAVGLSDDGVVITDDNGTYTSSG
jgi:type II secretory pathway pseudopilin PulG